MNNVVENIISNMLPSELARVKALINSLLETKNMNRTTNLDYLARLKQVECPNGDGHHIKKNGHKNGTQQYWCYNCLKSFSLTDHNIIKSSSLNYYQFKKFLQCMYDYKPLSETAQEIGISKTSTFELQIRIFHELDQIESENMLKDIIQVDEKYITTSFKGSKIICQDHLGIMEKII